MLERLTDPRNAAIATPNAHALMLLDRVLAKNPSPVICEVGIGIGATTVELCRKLDNRGQILLFDFEDRLDDLMIDLKALGFENVVPYTNTRRRYDSYNWTLGNLLLERRRNGEGPLFDFAFLDGAHAFQHDAPAALLLKELLKPGGYLLLDDYDWSFAVSPTMNPTKKPDILLDYTDAQIETPHVRLICDLFFDDDPAYRKVDLGYKSREHRRAYQKAPFGE
jgi:predicted O-methyltransferase YrrM